MKKHLFLAILAFGFLSLQGILTSCSSETNTTSIKIPVDSIFRNVLKDEAETTGQQYTLRITAAGPGYTSVPVSFAYIPTSIPVSKPINDIPVGILLAVTAEVIENENTTYSGISEQITTKEGENKVDITMKKLLSSVIVKTEATEISDCEISLSVMDGENTTTTYTPTAEQFLAGYEIKYLTIGSTYTFTATASSNGTAVYKGSSGLTVAKDENDNTCTIEMKKVESDGSVEIKQLPQNIVLELLTDSSDTDTTTEISLSNKKTARFKVSYLEGNDRAVLPDWVTYNWKLNDTDLEIDGTIASFDSTTGILTLDTTRTQSLIVGSNCLYVEISDESSSQVTAASENFTVSG